MIVCRHLSSSREFFFELLAGVIHDRARSPLSLVGITRGGTVVGSIFLNGRAQDLIAARDREANVR